MGDSGSTTIGFIIVVFGIYLSNHNYIDFFYTIILTSLFWFDATLTLIRRALNKEKLSLAHKKHAYQRLIQSGLSHKVILIIGFSVNLLLFGICLLMNYFNIRVYWSFLLTLLVCTVMMLYADKRFAFK
jgi:Fuc2NAc and GlcNAc transferase